MIILLITIVINLTVGNGDIKCIEIERQVLLSFKRGLIDTNGMLVSWRYENVEDCCNWRGVKCSNLTSHIIKLDLCGSYPQKYLSSKIGSSLLKLSDLSYLDLSDNNFTGIPIPNHLDSLVNLMYLNLSYNKFYGTIPPHLGNLSSLHTLDLLDWHEDHLISSRSLEWLSHLSSLQYLDLSGINLENATDWMQVINRLPHLKTLTLSSCSLPPPIFPSYPYVNISTSLSKLDLSANYHLTSSIFLWLSNFSTSLDYLDLVENNFQGYIPNAFANMTSLSYINFGLNELVGASPQSFWNLCNLQTLTLSFNKFKGILSEFLQILSGCAQNSLQNLHLSRNKFSGPVPDFSMFPNLKLLYLSSNELSGKIPISLGQLSNLETLNLRCNSLEGTIFEAHFSKLTKLRSMDLSVNSLNFHPHSNWIPPFQLDFINLGSCNLGPNFPSWLQGQHFSYLDISNASISDTIPHWFWNFSPDFESLDLSYNKIKGELPSLSINFRGNEIIYLKSNEFEGQIPLFLLQVGMLDVSSNKFSRLTSVCGINAISPLYYLKASNNQFSEELPNCWWNLSNLQFLDLASNGFSGGIATSFNNLNSLQSLHLHNNSFSGIFPSWLKNLSDLESLDLEGNNLTGEIPAWIGNKLSKLRRLSLRSNEFHGDLPSSLCHLNAILFLDLSLNNITGVVPNCLHNLSALTGNMDVVNPRYFLLDSRLGPFMHFSNEEMIMTWKGKEYIMKNTLPFLRSIDFSGNRLNGKIPNEIVELVELISLNLSRNNLIGAIPENIGQLKALDFLDLSRNELVGQIPSSLSQISGLSVLDLSYNKLSGEIPIGTQLQSFIPSVYEGNTKLCGAPLPRCPEGDMVPNSIDKKDDADDNEFATQAFFISSVLGFIIGFWGMSGTLMFHRLWRHAYFKFLSDLNNCFYVKVAISMNKVQKLFKD